MDSESKPLWQRVKEYCLDRLGEIEKINKENHCPSAFVCIATFMGFLSRLASGSNLANAREDGSCFREFVKKYMPQKYRSDEVVTLMYKTFRCGIVHAMSFDPEIADVNRTVYLAEHAGSTSGYAKLGISHDEKFSPYCTGTTLQKVPRFDMYVLEAQTLCADIKDAIEQMFSVLSVQRNSQEYVCVQRPISGFSVPPESLSPALSYGVTDEVVLSSSAFSFSEMSEMEA